MFSFINFFEGFDGAIRTQMLSTMSQRIENRQRRLIFAYEITTFEIVWRLINRQLLSLCFLLRMLDFRFEYVCNIFYV